MKMYNQIQKCVYLQWNTNYKSIQAIASREHLVQLKQSEKILQTLLNWNADDEDESNTKSRCILGDIYIDKQDVSDHMLHVMTGLRNFIITEKHGIKKAYNYIKRVSTTYAKMDYWIFKTTKWWFTMYS